MSGRPRTVFLGMHEVAGYYAGLAEGLEAHGCRTVRVELVRHPFRYPAAPPPTRLLRLLASTARRRSDAGRSARLAWRASQLPVRLLVLCWAAARCDAFVFGFGSAIFHPAELRLLRALGKPVVHIFHGSDSRPPWMDGFDVNRIGEGRPLKRLTRRRAARVRHIERHTTAIVCNPASAQLHTRPFACFLRFGIPVPPPAPPAGGAIHPEGGRGAAVRPVRLLHSPSRPLEKGTAAIRDAVATVAARGHAVELVEITGRPNAEVVAAILDADLVLDQLYTDQPMAGLATEAATLGRPTLVAGYAAGDEGACLPLATIPTRFVRSERFVDALEELVVDAAGREQLGRAASEFVATEWAPAVVARRLLDLLDGATDPRLLVDPSEITYVHGYGQTEERVRAVIAGLVSAYGTDALQIGHNPRLEAAALALAAAADHQAEAPGMRRGLR